MGMNEDYDARNVSYHKCRLPAGINCVQIRLASRELPVESTTIETKDNFVEYEKLPFFQMIVGLGEQPVEKLHSGFILGSFEYRIPSPVECCSKPYMYH